MCEREKIYNFLMTIRSGGTFYVIYEHHKQIFTETLTMTKLYLHADFDKP